MIILQYFYNHVLSWAFSSQYIKSIYPVPLDKRDTLYINLKLYTCYTYIIHIILCVILFQLIYYICKIKHPWPISTTHPPPSSVPAFPPPTVVGTGIPNTHRRRYRPSHRSLSTVPAFPPPIAVGTGIFTGHRRWWPVPSTVGGRLE